MSIKAYFHSPTCKIKVGLWRLARLLYFISLSTVTMADESSEIAVVYPMVREPFAALYREYIVGIKQSKPGQISEFHANANGQKMLTRMTETTVPDVFIALGNKSVKMVDSLNAHKPIVAVVANKDYEGVITGGILLQPAADTYLTSLFQIYSAVQEVFVVYNPEHDQGLVDDAARLLEKKHVPMTAIPAQNIREAASGYQAILKNAKPYSAVWLLTDNSFIDRSLLSTILDVAWDKKLIVFSSNPLFVKHGALFAIYPDNKGVGLTLGSIAQDIQNRKNPGLQSLTDIRLAVNERTVNHLGIELSPQVRQKIELMLPGR